MKLPERILTWGLILLLLILIAATIFLASVPPVDRDALTHHLFVPKLWLKHGGIYEIPEITFSYYPMNLDLLYTIPLYFGNDIIPKYIHYCFALLTGLLLYRHLAKRLGTPYGLLGALFFLSVPIIIKLSITVYVDLGLIFFTTAALLLLLRWAEENFQSRFLILAGLCCGLAAGTKYNGLISIAVLALLVPILYQRYTPSVQQSNGKALLWGMVFVIATLATYSPWLLRNYFWTGNPIYPLHNSLFQKLKKSEIALPAITPDSNTDTSQEATPPASNAFVARKILYNESWWQTLLLPIRYFFEGQDDNPQYFDGKLSPFLLILPFFAFLFRRPDTRLRREQIFLLSFSVMYFFFTFFQEVLRIRYIAPIIPPLTILSVYGIHNIFVAISSRNKSPINFSYVILCTVTSLILFTYNIEYLLNQFRIVEPLNYLSGNISRDQYINNYRPEYQAIKFTDNLNEKSVILAVFIGSRGYYFDRKVQFDTLSGDSVFFIKNISKNTTSNIIEILNNKNISHIIIRLDLFYQWIEQQLDQYEIKILESFFQKNTILLYEKNGYSVFQIIY
jgi:4-amino-4-deoxy-L-arabinose transferase-like glycosyltransferase